MFPIVPHINFRLWLFCAPSYQDTRTAEPYSVSTIMISNFHQTSGPSHGSAYYTMSGFDDGVSPANSDKAKSKKFGGRGIFGRIGRKSNKVVVPQRQPSMDESTGHSMSYSSVSSFQTTGESTDSSGFGHILRVLDEEDRKEVLAKQQRLQQQRLNQTRPFSTSSNFSTTSSLAYSEGNTTLNYSEEESYLAGSKLLSDSGSQNLLGEFLDDSSDYFQERDMRLIGAAQPKTKASMDMMRTSTSGTDTKSNRMRSEGLRETKSPQQNWFTSCGIEMPDKNQVNQAKGVLRPYLCFL